MVLNQLYLGRFPTNDEIRRQPGELHERVYRRLRGCLTVCGASREMFPLAPGRAGPQLAEAFMHLESFVESCAEFGDAYSRSRTPELYVENSSLLPLDEFPQLEPHRNLQPNRLKIIGRGLWDMQSYLEDALWLPFVEPAFLLHGEKVPRKLQPTFAYEDKNTNFELAKLWDVNGMLGLCDAPLRPDHFCRVFQVYKNESIDRQIGDRRLPNLREYHVDGPSKHLPSGHLLAQLHVAQGQKLLGSVTDRRDFYHQALVSDERARTNMLPFSFPLNDFSGTLAHEAYLKKKETLGRRKRSRTDDGDQLGKAKHEPPPGPFGEVSENTQLGKAKHEPPSGSLGEVFPVFRSLFQGDHLGVEFALSSRERLLVDEGLLIDKERLLGHHRVPFGPRWTGLIIDDFFALGAERISTPKLNSFACRALGRARAIYDKHRLEGSPEKDVEAEDHFKAAGAEIDSRLETLRSGACYVGAPLAKRIALSTMSLRVARLPSITPKLAARLTGNWVSVLLYRRCLTSIVDETFTLGSGLERDDCPPLLPLSRRAAEEMVLLACVAPLAVANIAVDYSKHLHLSDSSIEKGAFVSGHCSEKTAMALWQSSEKKGGYTMLDSPLRSRLKELLGEMEVPEEIGAVQCGTDSIYKPPLLRFDFVEICGGAGEISKAAAALGLVVAPVLDLSDSNHYDLRGLRFLQWVVHMVEVGRFASFMVEPPCTSFSAAAHPMVRSYSNPYGFDLTNPKTYLGNQLAYRSFVILKELGFANNILASCQFGSIHKKEFMFLTYMIESLTVRCPGGHDHVKIEGKYTKPSAAYVPGLAKHVALGFARALRRCRAEVANEAEVTGLESVVANDVVLTTPWKLRKCWSWKRKSHINVLESFAAVAALEDASMSSPDARLCLGVDSQVSKGALSKGRSSAYSLQPMMKRSCAVQIAFGAYPAWFFAPTRLNVADDPTRGEELRSTSCQSLSGFFDLDSLADLHYLGFRRFAANWIRLFILIQLPGLAGASSLDFGDAFASWTFSHSGGYGFGICPWNGFGLDLLHALDLWRFLGFACCLGFGILAILLGSSHHSILPLSWRAPSFFLPLSICLLLLLGGGRKDFGGRTLRGYVGLMIWVAPCHAMMPTSAAERERAALRSAFLLPADRVVRKETRKRRMQLIAVFREWLWKTHGISFRNMLDIHAGWCNTVSSVSVRRLICPRKAQLQAAHTTLLVSVLAELLGRLASVTENSELVRRRGRWLSSRVMEIYLQEIEAVTYIHRLNHLQRLKISDLVLAFPSVLEKAIYFLEHGIPTSTWFNLMSHERSGSWG
eukprot:Skav202550  [mRNA]  locus=scaffold2011:388236:392729:- [translate_table: standard]